MDVAKIYKKIRSSFVMYCGVKRAIERRSESFHVDKEGYLAQEAKLDIAARAFLKELCSRFVLLRHGSC